MRTTLTIVDDFHPDAAALRARVMGSEFSSKIGPDGATYTGISLHEAPELVQLIEKVVGHKIIPHMQFWRINLDKEMPHSFVHSDEICATHASILYMNEPAQCRGGTAFWKHVELGLDAMPTPDEAVAMGRNYAELDRQIGLDWKNLEKWSMCGFVGMKFNRFVTYPTKCFHSRFPHEGFGAGKEDGRLIWVCFYDIDPTTPAR